GKNYTSKNKTILVIEDNENDQFLIMRSIRKHNIANDIFVVGDGIEALDYLYYRGRYKDSNHTAPHLILLDLKLPKMGGLEVLKKIRENPETALIPVIILTSSDEEKDIVSSYKLGANSYVRKPIDFVEFAEAIKNLGLYWLILNVSAE
ncbi:MAG: hypothetical protein PWQ77_2127, partial [Kosmotogales bacterium]|nr:hypothetical protein [Kosmotogales bacterium]